MAQKQYLQHISRIIHSIMPITNYNMYGIYARLVGNTVVTCGKQNAKETPLYRHLLSQL